MSGFSILPHSCPSISCAPSGNLAPQPPFLPKQSQPPPYSFLPLIIAAAPQTGHLRCASRHLYLDSRVEHEPEHSANTSPPCLMRQVQVTSRCPFSSRSMRGSSYSAVKPNVTHRISA